MFKIARSLLSMINAERAHELSLRVLEAGLYKRGSRSDHPCLRINIMGLDFPNPIGIAAGFDKDARVFKAVQDIGFGYSEVGTVTPRLQLGNHRPRVIRLNQDKAIINRLGFNNCGHDVAYERLLQRDYQGIIGINIGANKDTVDKTYDYEIGIKKFYNLANYFMINVSSPNTPGLRDLQSPKQLKKLLMRIDDVRNSCTYKYGKRIPIAIKLSPDIACEDIPMIIEQIIAYNIDAIAVSNTTLSRPSNLKPRFVKESGGLSGQPLFQRSTVLLARVYKAVRGTIPLIGIGGITSGESAQAKIEAGASLIQLYTGLIYQGLPLLNDIKSHLTESTKRNGANRLEECIGIKSEEWAAKPLDECKC